MHALEAEKKKKNIDMLACGLSGCLFTRLRLLLNQTASCKRLVTKNHKFFLVGPSAIHVYDAGFAEAALGCFSPSLFTFLSEQCEWILIHSHCSLNSFFYKKKTVQWIINSLALFKFTRTVISILFMIIFYLILLHAQKIMETVVLVGWILYVMEL